MATRSQDGILPGGTSALFRDNREDHECGELLRYPKALAAMTFAWTRAIWVGKRPLVTRTLPAISRPPMGGGACRAIHDQDVVLAGQFMVVLDKTVPSANTMG